MAAYVIYAGSYAGHKGRFDSSTFGILIQKYSNILD